MTTKTAYLSQEQCCDTRVSPEVATHMQLKHFMEGSHNKTLEVQDPVGTESTVQAKEHNRSQHRDVVRENVDRWSSG